MMPNFETMVLICNILEVSPNYLFADSLKYLNGLSEKAYAQRSHERVLIENLVDGLLNAAEKLVEFENIGREDMTEKDKERE